MKALENTLIRSPPEQNPPLPPAASCRAPATVGGLDSLVLGPQDCHLSKSRPTPGLISSRFSTILRQASEQGWGNVGIPRGFLPLQGF